MKKIILIACVFISLTAFSQSRYSRGPSFKEFGMGVGAFWPALDYYNERTGYEFNQGLSSQLYGNIALNSIIGVRLGVGYNYINGTQQVTSEWAEETSIGIMPLNAELLFNYGVGGRSGSQKFSRSAFTPNFYIGGGGGYDFLFIKYSTPTGGNQNNVGATFSYHALLGVQFPIGPMKLGLEGQYIFGSYSQAFVLNNGSESAEVVSINGPKAFVTIAYPLNSISSHSRSSYGRRRTYHSKRYKRGGLFKALFRSNRPRRR
ncbi:hypothetical protein [Marinoscillum pacificum]|uniref:hypothetical protein n=1 Tax=Marinoscillum pacificum TaxID=392723 RepID=UPI0021574E3D|nr:hypothetical protein [Marinoscillum pacificum]